MMPMAGVNGSLVSFLALVAAAVLALAASGASASEYDVDDMTNAEIEDLLRTLDYIEYNK